MYTVRGFVREKDGAIHTNSETKIITVLLYMNERWQEDAGRLRLLRSPTDLEDYVAEVPPYGGTLLVFRRSDNSWHGHKPISGPRRAMQFNWVTTQDVVDHEQRRHQFSTKFKKFKNMFIPSSVALGHRRRGRDASRRCGRGFDAGRKPQRRRAKIEGNLP